jgi:hypothetical protein
MRSMTERPISAEVERESRWRSRQPMRAKGDSGPPRIAEATVTRIDDGWVYLRVTRGHGSRRGRTYGMAVDDLLTGWTRHD